ncbi:phage tail sheath C-terminal domain-containing protein [Oceanicella sp. SM1341]|uniref:phage tail sheath family protein n=1 Tax=Oceanicella sp. SM1341 TaxID=1548889 RepID=UPI0018E58FC4|nr:phage tail sheath C-terminal domain-containing protein [Oceanicella sp. SM1341]
MITPSYPGVYVLERASGARSISGVATSITAFVGMTQRGPVRAPRRVLSPRDFERIFGPSVNTGAMAEQVRLFFDNGGGEAWVTRIAHESAAATIMLRGEDGTDRLRLVALEDGAEGNSLRAEVDYDTATPEATFNLRLYRRVALPDGSVQETDPESFPNLSMNPDDNRHVAREVNNVSALARVEVPGTGAAGHAESILYAGLILPNAGAAGGNTIRARLGGAGDYTLQLRLNGGPASTVNVAVGAGQTSIEIATAIGAAIQQRLQDEGITQVVTGATINPGNRRYITLAMPGASFEILPGPVNDLVVPLMLSGASGGLYIDRFAANRPAPSGFVSQIHANRGTNDLARITTFAGHDKAGIETWTITDASPAGSPATDQSVVYPLPGGLMITGTRFAATEPGDASLGALINVQENLQAIADAVSADLNERWSAEVHGLRLVMRPAFGTSDADPTAAFATASSGVTVNLGAANQILEAASDYNVAAYTFGDNATGLGGGAFQDRAGATAGDDGELPLPEDYRAAFGVMEREVDLFNLLVLPRARASNGTQSDTARKDAFNLASSFAARQRAFLLADPPSTDPVLRWDDANEAAAGADLFRIGMDTRNSAVFWPRLRRSDGSFHDPAGPIAGLMARTDGTRGVWKAAAGVEATLRGVTGVEYRMSDPENGLVNPEAVNALRVFPDGILSWGARTLVGFDGSGNMDDKYIPVRRTMLFIEESLYRGLRFAVFEPNDEPLWAQIRLAAGSFMNTLFRQGAFAGSKASDAYFVTCDATTTTASDINLGIVNVIVGFAPLKPAEFVVLTVTQIAGQAEV